MKYRTEIGWLFVAPAALIQPHESGALVLPYQPINLTNRQECVLHKHPKDREVV